MENPTSVRSVVHKGKKNISSKNPLSIMAAKGAGSVDPLQVFNIPKSKMAASYHLPSIKKSMLRTIRKKHFCCFDKLKPKKLYLRSQEEKLGKEKLDLRFDLKKKRLEVSKQKSLGVQNFSEWMETWNIFTQAHLHYFPEDGEALFSYQKSITRFHVSYPFEAVYSYDIDFRNLLAIEKNLPPEEKQVEWAKINEELEQVHLKGNRRTEPTCYKCNTKGHYSNKCPHDVSGSSQPFPVQVVQPRPPPAPPVAPRPQPLMARNVFPTTQTTTRRMLPYGGNTSGNGVRNPSRKFCNHFKQNGTCPFGASCVFRHECEFCNSTQHHTNACFQYTSAPFRGAQGP